ncbi:hypothetical protein HO133_004856 [Letharia lupina]|uniref:Uncharacterized protein n=1 Tax=Letharia lupina TaxID=560253 RepID=A0A8H6FL43_9LECA|nr:uncharacterized protein HO133_004856 [Letharia lupina]KAF6230512.1 hypothetical protein HO133_004856 [Letharia lupina]
MCLGSQDPKDLLVNINKDPTEKIHPSRTQLTMSSLKTAKLKAIKASTPESYMSHIAWVWVKTQELLLKAESDALEAKMLRLQKKYSRLSARHPAVKPAAVALNKDWFIKEGEAKDEKLAGLMKAFKAAGGGVEDAGKVERLLKIGLEWSMAVKMQLVAVRDAVGQLKKLSAA